MDSKYFVLSLLLLLTSVFSGISGCSAGGYVPDEKESENIIGSPLKSVSETTKVDGQDKNIISIFDNTVRKIHIFDLQSMTSLNSFTVKNPEKDHYVLTQDQGAYVIDMSEKTVSLHFSHEGTSQTLFTFMGNPISAAYRSDLNLLVIYDDLSNVGIAKIDPSGLNHQFRIFGPVIDEKNIRAGDLMEDGRLILALSDDSVYIVDTNLSLKNKKWEFSSFPTSLVQINWLAPIVGAPTQVFVKSKDKISILDLDSKTLLSELDVSGYKIEKYSKFFNSHILIRGNSNHELKVVYAKDNQVVTRNLFKQENYILYSHLNIAEDTWTYVDTSSKYTVYYYFNDLNQIKESRLLKRYRISDLLGLSRQQIRADAQIQLTQNYVFSLIQSELGHAIRSTIDSDQVKELKLFNMRHL